MEIATERQLHFMLTAIAITVVTLRTVGVFSKAKNGRIGDLIYFMETVVK